MEQVPTGDPCRQQRIPGRQTPPSWDGFPGRREGRHREAKNQAWNSKIRRQHHGLGSSRAALTHSRLQKPLLESMPQKCPNLIFPLETGSENRETHI